MLDSPATTLEQPSGIATRASAMESELRPELLSSDELLRGRKEVWIEHRGDMYRLRLTGSGKLYLTK